MYRPILCLSDTNKRYYGDVRLFNEVVEPRRAVLLLGRFRVILGSRPGSMK